MALVLKAHSGLLTSLRAKRVAVQAPGLRSVVPISRAPSRRFHQPLIKHLRLAAASEPADLQEPVLGEEESEETDGEWGEWGEGGEIDPELLAQILAEAKSAGPSKVVFNPDPLPEGYELEGEEGEEEIDLVTSRDRTLFSVEDEDEWDTADNVDWKSVQKRSKAELEEDEDADELDVEFLSEAPSDEVIEGDDSEGEAVDEETDQETDEEGEQEEDGLGVQLEAARDKRDEALALLKNWKPQMLEELYPEGKVPGFSKQQSQDLWRSLRYFLAVEAIDATYEVQNLTGDGEGYVEFEDDDDFEEEDMEEDDAVDVALYEQYDALVQEVNVTFKDGDKVYGAVYKIDDDGAYVELGGKCAGFCPVDECSYAKLQSAAEVLTPGSKREFTVVEIDRTGLVILSLREAEKNALWIRLQQMKEEEITIYATVVAAAPGGLYCEYEGITAFLPGTQYSMALAAENVEELVGYQIAARIFEADEEMERIVLSNRKASGEVDVQGYKIGDVLDGTVQSVKPYGAFIDLGGVTGLLHISQISHDRVASMEKILNEGDKIKVMVLSMDKERGRVTLSTKKLEPTPGDFLRDPELVFQKAAETAELFRQRMLASQQAGTDGQYMGSMDDNYDLPMGDYPQYPMEPGMGYPMDPNMGYPAAYPTSYPAPPPPEQQTPQ